MDTQEFDVIVIETIELVDRSIEAMALDTVECFPGDGELRLEFNDMSTFRLGSDRAAQQLHLQTPESGYSFSWSEVEEQWVETDGALDLFRVLSREMGRRFGGAFVLQEAE